jgi:hypothetical protein
VGWYLSFSISERPNTLIQTKSSESGVRNYLDSMYHF